MTSLKIYTEDMKTAHLIPEKILIKYTKYYDGSGGDVEGTYQEFFYYDMSAEEIEDMINLIKQSGIKFEFTYEL